MAGVGKAPKSFHSGECKQDRHHSPAVYCVAFGHLPFMGGSIQDIGEVIKTTTETYPAQARLEATQVALTVARQVMAVGITSFESLHARKWIKKSESGELFVAKMDLCCDKCLHLKPGSPTEHNPAIWLGHDPGRSLFILFSPVYVLVLVFSLQVCSTAIIGVFSKAFHGNFPKMANRMG